MNRRMRYSLLFSGVCVTLCPALLAAPAPDPGVTTVTCPVNEDRVWVYDSLTTLDVEAKLHCGDTVQIVSRVKGYVKVRIASGVVGYMPDSVFPDLPPLTEDQDKLGDHNAAPTETTQNDISSLAAVAATYRARERAAADAASAREAAAVTSAAPEAAPVAAPKPAPSIVASAEQPAAPEVAAPVAAVAPVTPRAPSPAHVSARKPLIVIEPPEPAPAPRPTVSVATTVQAKPVIVAAPAPAPQPAAPEVPATAATVAVSAPGPMDPPIPAPTAMPAVTAPADASLREVAAKPIGTDPESEDYPDTQPENESADPNCRVYFSAYGLGAEQYKWLSEARKKQFSGICPAPNLKSVDFVILFTHDTDSYVSAMPSPVHTDRNGFSDFDPMTTVDTALMSPTQADKAHYELAWVFHMRRGAFDPAGFSPRRRPQYESTAKGAHASTKAVEDAFNFIQQNGTR
jgi:hypothetical protein